MSLSLCRKSSVLFISLGQYTYMLVERLLQALSLWLYAFQKVQTAEWNSVNYDIGEIYKKEEVERLTSSLYMMTYQLFCAHALSRSC